MATNETQISTIISGSTKEMVDRYTEAHGVKKGHLIEEALLHHLQALRELPADIIIPPSYHGGRAHFYSISASSSADRSACFRIDPNVFLGRSLLV